MTLVRSGIREAEPRLADHSLGIWKIGRMQQNAWLYHGELCTGLFECGAAERMALPWGTLHRAI